MRKMIDIAIILLFLYLVLQVVYGYLVGGHKIAYVVDVEGERYVINETFTSRYRTLNNEKYDNRNYYYEITKFDGQEILYNFKLVGNYRGEKKFIHEMRFYVDDKIRCIYPVFKNHNNLLDVLCHDGEKQFNYLNEKGRNGALDNFVSGLKELGYEHPSWGDLNLETTPVENFEMYKHHIISKQHIVVWNYKGFYEISVDGLKSYSFLANDVYNNNLAVLINQHYVVPDYKEGNNFSKFITTNILTSAASHFELDFTISGDSFIQGVVDGNVYIIDKASKKQYEVNPHNKKINLLGDVNRKAMYFYNGKWEERSIHEIIDNNLVFKYDIYVPEELEKYGRNNITNVMGDTDGYYYIHIQEGNSIAVYRAHKQNPSILTLLFRSPTINNMKYIGDSMYFINQDTLYMYNDFYGLRPLIKYNEFKFNKNNMYEIFTNK
jgi:hypothetical protein